MNIKDVHTDNEQDAPIRILSDAETSPVCKSRPSISSALMSDVFSAPVLLVRLLFLPAPHSFVPFLLHVLLRSWTPVRLFSALSCDACLEEHRMGHFVAPRYPALQR